MVRQLVVPQVPSSAGAAPVAVASTVDGHRFPNDGHTIVLLENTSVGPVNVTFVTPAVVDALAVPDRVIVVAAAAKRLVGNLGRGAYNQPEDTADAGQVYVDFSVVAATITATYID